MAVVGIIAISLIAFCGFGIWVASLPLEMEDDNVL